MSDVFSKRKRSEIMSRVRSRRNERTELELIRQFRQNGITGWRRNQKLFGAPDFVFPRQRVAVFVDGCFWHSCPTHRSTPATNRRFWTEKLRRNQIRDGLVTRTLRRRGWSVLRIWQHELNADHKATTLKRMKLVLKARLSATRTLVSPQKRP
jgi:DNA mismatch endonuclease (patch repair protein)